MSPNNQYYYFYNNAVYHSLNDDRLLYVNKDYDNDTFELKEGIFAIGDNAFYNCSCSTVVLPEGFTTIERFTFQGFKTLVSVELPSTLSNIENDAFLECASLRNITIPNSVVSIGDGAFMHCTALESVALPSSLEQII